MKAASAIYSNMKNNNEAAKNLLEEMVIFA